jgi:hypothetical protein
VSAENAVHRSIERRSFRRFALMLPVLFRWADSSEHYDGGQCANVGLGGMFVFTQKCPPVGAQVEIEVVIPAFAGVPRELRLRYIGQVTRVEACCQIAGFAVSGRIEGQNQEEQLKDMVCLSSQQ